MENIAGLFVKMHKYHNENPSKYAYFKPFAGARTLIRTLDNGRTGYRLMSRKCESEKGNTGLRNGSQKEH